MRAIRRDHTTHVLGAPRDWDEEKHGPCEGLPVSHHDGVFYSYWTLSWRERLAVLFGRPIRLCVVGEGHPPVALDLED